MQYISVSNIRQSKGTGRPFPFKKFSNSHIGPPTFRSPLSSIRSRISSTFSSHHTPFHLCRKKKNNSNFLHFLFHSGILPSPTPNTPLLTGLFDLTPFLNGTEDFVMKLGDRNGLLESRIYFLYSSQTKVSCWFERMRPDDIFSFSGI